MKIIRKIKKVNEKTYTNYYVVFDNGDFLEIEPHWKDARNYIVLRSQSIKED